MINCRLSLQQYHLDLGDDDPGGGGGSGPAAEVGWRCGSRSDGSVALRGLNFRGPNADDPGLERVAMSAVCNEMDSDDEDLLLAELDVRSHFVKRSRSVAHTAFQQIAGKGRHGRN